MKSIYLNAGRTQDVFNDFKDSLNGTLSVNNDEYNLALQSNFANGTITGITFPDGMTFMEFDVVFHDDVRLSMESFSNSPLFFVYCSLGKFQHSFGELRAKNKLGKNQMGILKSTTSVNSIFYFEKHTPIQFSLITMQTISNNENAELINKLKNAFFNTKEDYLYVRPQDTMILTKLKELQSLRQKGIVGHLLKNRILENILEIEIELHTDSFTEMGQAINSFVTHRVDEIVKVKNSIANFPAELETRFSTLKTKFLTHLSSGRALHDFLIFIKVERQRI